ncbi:polysaccharide biosynthesis/export family protein [Nodosilinea sp. P-1105]|uniref:SLBB domain-containing protein n=1 Tax=Nodosilinea sp. P-1105 TaxID=2546229 RepID=UPI00146D19B9|nr:polysaccharide biosynthesis/export family protein [Nodosilinea sp. P-1105]NMF85162.1 polysaccharide export protein [Nodosilinea sp. P-1105]
MASRFIKLSVSSITLSGLLLSYVTPVLAQAEVREAEPSGAPSESFIDFSEPSSPGQRDLPVPSDFDDDAYVLNSGDVVQFDIFNVPELGNGAETYNVLVDGTINLPWIGRVYVRGLSLEEATREVEQRYSQMILDPVVTLTLTTTRPSTVAVVGEVNRPGSFTTRPRDGGGEGFDGDDPNPREVRTVVQAIRLAGGITQMADIRNVQVRRPQANGPDRVTTVDFFALLKDGSQTPNILVRDGDTIFVPTATALLPEESQTIAAANFSPSAIGVDVVGEVKDPGRVEIKPNSTLNQAILAAGGFDDPRAQSGEVAFIRLNQDGTVTNRVIPVDLSAGLNDENNPSLRENDVVIVSRSGVTRTSDFLELIGGAASAIINPVLGITNIINLLDRIGNPDRD